MLISKAKPKRPNKTLKERERERLEALFSDADGFKDHRERIAFMNAYLAGMARTFNLTGYGSDADWAIRIQKDIANGRENALR